MFKTGDIVTFNEHRKGIRIGIRCDSGFVFLDRPDDEVADIAQHFFKPYTGPIYNRGGQRFVPSGEFRAPKVGEVWALNGTVSGPFHQNQSNSDWPEDSYRPILLPVPSLEPEPEQWLKSRLTGLTKQFRDLISPWDLEDWVFIDKPEPEFKVGDWVKASKGHTGQVSNITNSRMDLSDGEFFWMDKTVKAGLVTKLPGRPLTTDDLMRVLSGEKVMVECHACGCDGMRGQVYHEAHVGRIDFHHIWTTYPIAELINGFIAFSDGVKNNIFVVNE